MICGLLAGTMLAPAVQAQSAAPTTSPPATTQTAPPRPADDGDIVPEAEFDAALPSLSGDINAPLEPMSGFDTPADTQQPTPATPPAAATTSPTAPTTPPTAPATEASVPAETLPDAVLPEAPELAQPLT
ncbi:hypothetical protein DMC47_23090, partial [Nostoc sp. 3335mG]